MGREGVKINMSPYMVHSPCKAVYRKVAELDGCQSKKLEEALRTNKKKTRRKRTAPSKCSIFKTSLIKRD